MPADPLAARLPKYYNSSDTPLFNKSENLYGIDQARHAAASAGYLAVVEGVPAQREGTLKDRLIESKSLMVRRVEEGGDLAITHYRVLRAKGDRALLELTLETGRRNQIRVQLATLGHPVAGDRKYGAKTDPARRLALHAHELRFRHPISNDSMEFYSALPQRLAGLVEGRTLRGSRDA